MRRTEMVKCPPCPNLLTINFPVTNNRLLELMRYNSNRKNAILPILWNLARALNIKPSDLVRDAEKIFSSQKAKD